MHVLKSCPFCGSTDLLDRYVLITCKHCLAQGPAMNGGKNDDHADCLDNQNAVKAWNRRVDE